MSSPRFPSRRPEHRRAGAGSTLPPDTVPLGTGQDAPAGSVWPSQSPALDSAIEQGAISHFDPQPGAAARAVALRAERLVLCQPALALRLVLAVVAAVVLGTLPAARGWHDWLLLAPVAGVATVAAMLLWLPMVCALRDHLPRWRPALATAVVVGAGGAAALAGNGLCWLLGVAAPGAWPAFAAMACGGCLAAAIWAWMGQRAAAGRPAQDRARLAELQSRIRPHFLFNALNTALALVQVDPPRAESVLEDLALLFRVALAETGEAVSLDEEVTLARRYLAIEQIRFGDRLRLSWDLDVGAGAARLPPLVLQPLVENAVRHGVEPSSQGGEVRVRSRAWRGMALLEVSSTLPPEPGPPGTGVALANVRERLRLLHDLAGRLHTETRDGCFIARIEVPL